MPRRTYDRRAGRRRGFPGYGREWELSMYRMLGRFDPPPATPRSPQEGTYR